jgi:hypothetical protein
MKIEVFVNLLRLKRSLLGLKKLFGNRRGKRNTQLLFDEEKMKEFVASIHCE